MSRLVEGICTQLTSAVIARCKATKIFTVDDFLFQDPELLSKDIDTSFKDVLLIRDALLLKYSPYQRRGDSLLSEVLNSLAIFETGSERINKALQGGVYTGEVTEIHGPPGSGKTQFCLDVITNMLMETPCTVLYMDSNCTFSAGRVEELLLQKSEECIVLNEKLQRIKVINMYDVYNFLDVLYYVEDALQKKENNFFKNLKLVVVDSLTHILAPCFGGHFLEGGGMISLVAELFNIICFKYALSIMVCNNTVQSKSSIIKPALGASWKYVPSVSLCIQKVNNNEKRKLNAVKSCRTALFKDVLFCIGKSGISN